jgi:nitrogen fixation protein NifB
MHPCFQEEAKHTHSRVHLPVAPRCNIQCNYCNRKYDCVSESRPGVTSCVLAPVQAVEYLRALDERMEQLSVVGIAGPGDPFANPEETMDTLRGVRAAFPGKLICLSTNGLELQPYIGALAELGVSHVTLTINGIDPEVLSKVYQWVRFRKKVYRGIEAARVLLEQQLGCIPLLKAKGIVVKINFIVIPGVNEHEIGSVARVCADLGADMINCIPLLPTPDTLFEGLEKPDAKTLFRVRTLAAEHLPLMSHCARCRADAAGLLGQDLSDTHALMQEYASRLHLETEGRPYVAVGTNEGLLVNLHLGEATVLYIYRQTAKGFQFVEERRTPAPGTGDRRWLELARLLSDCRALLVSGAGEIPKSVLNGCSVHVIEMTGLIDEGLEGVYHHRVIRSIAKPDAFRCGSGCKGNAQGCA